jgi:Ssp1 endopeptidase immunity protein Rap1a
MDGGEHMKPDLAFCVPKGVTYAQGTRIVVKYMDANPQDLHIAISVLTVFALKETWPCPSQ